MNPLWRIVRVLGVGALVLLAIIGSIWVSQADVLMSSVSPRYVYILPTPTLFPTAAPTAVMAAAEEPTEAFPTSAPEAPLPSETPTLAPSPSPTPCLPAPGWVSYTVQKGDTYLELARRSQTNVQGLLAGNCLEEAGELQVGSILYLPAIAVATPTSTSTSTSTPTATSTPAPAPTAVVCYRRTDWPSIIVARGDTLYGLSIRYGTTVAVLVKANCLTNDAVRAGERLYVPGPIVVYPTERPTIVWRTPTPFPTPTPFATPTPPLPTLTPTPADTPTATPKPSPTLTPTETPVLVPTWTPPPTGPLPTMTSTPAPALPEPTSTLAPTNTPEPTSASELPPAP